MTYDKTLEKALALVQNLYVRTSDGDVDWQVTGNERAFQAQLGDFTLRLTRIPDIEYQDSPDYELRVLDKSEREVESITNRSLRPVMDRSTPEGLNPYSLLDRTFEMARRQALGVDQAMDTLLQSLTKRSSS